MEFGTGTLTSLDGFRNWNEGLVWSQIMFFKRFKILTMMRESWD